MDWAAWGPTIVSLGAALIVIGGIWNNVKSNTNRLDKHDSRFELIEKKNNEQDVALFGLEQFQKGYSVARERYEGKPHNG